MCDGCLVATAEDDTEEGHLLRRASEVIVRRADNRDTLGTCVDTKICLRRDRILNLHRNLLHQDLVIDQQLVLNESTAMQRIDDVRFHALDEDFSEDEESKSNG